MIPCANFMNLEAMKETVRKHEETWGAPGEPYTELSSEQMVKNCSICDFGIAKISQITEPLMAVAGDMAAKLQQDVRRMTGEPLKRKCYRQVETMNCPRCDSSVVFPASNPRYRHRCHICDFKWRDEKNPKPVKK